VVLQQRFTLRRYHRPPRDKLLGLAIPQTTKCEISSQEKSSNKGSERISAWTVTKRKSNPEAASSEYTGNQCPLALGMDTLSHDSSPEAKPAQREGDDIRGRLINEKQSDFYNQ